MIKRQLQGLLEFLKMVRDDYKATWASEVLKRVEKAYKKPKMFYNMKLEPKFYQVRDAVTKYFGLDKAYFSTTFFK